MTIIKNYDNGNANIKLFDDGTRIIEYDNELKLDYPLNVDIRISTKCSFGLNNNGKAICNFCHESASVNGSHADNTLLLNKLSELPLGVELAIGANQIDNNTKDLLLSLKDRIVNLTVNQGHLPLYKSSILELIENNLIKGLGISFRPQMKSIPLELINYKNMVVHVIAGIDDIDVVRNLSNQGIKKILILGEKDFGFNKGKVDLKSEQWFKWNVGVRSLFDLFEIVSFDNLAIEQLKIKRFLSKSTYDTIYQGEYSIYINAVEKYFAPNSRSFNKTSWDNISIFKYFQNNCIK